jgi:hypothetical protein
MLIMFLAASSDKTFIFLSCILFIVILLFESNENVRLAFLIILHCTHTHTHGHNLDDSFLVEQIHDYIRILKDYKRQRRARLIFD